MSEHKCEIVILEIGEHDNADALEIAKIKGTQYQSIVRKGQFQTGDLAVYIPEQSIVPEWLLKNLGLWDYGKRKGKLAGKNGDRVKAVRLRGVFSQGLVYPLKYVHNLSAQQGDWKLIPPEDGTEKYVEIGQDVAEYLGITKWEPPIPTHMAGEVVALPGKTLKYDIENVKNYPNIAQALIDLQISVQITEKLHGTWCCIGVYPTDIHDEIPYKRVIITSKGLSGKGLAFKDNDANVNNLYMRTFKQLFDYDMFFNTLDDLVNPESGPMFFLGEIFGTGVQDLTYGLKDPEFRVFDIYDGQPGQGRYLTPYEVKLTINRMLLPFRTVPLLYEGPLTRDIIHEYTNGLDNINGSHIREGIVIRTMDREYRNDKIGRVILKSVSEDYLSRKDATEYN